MWKQVLAAGITVVFASAVPAQAQEAERPFTLEEALVRAYQTNPTLQAERARQRATDEQAAQARSNWRPTVSFNSDYSLGFQDVESSSLSAFANDPIESESRTEQFSRTYSLSAQQTIFRGFRNFTSIQQADASVRAGAAQLQTVEQQVLLEAVTAYFDVILQRETINLRENNVQVLRRQLQAAEDRFRVGEITRTDVAQAEARLASARSDLVQSEADLANAEATFANVIGVEPSSLERPDSGLDLPLEIRQVLDRASRANPAIEAARSTEEARQKAVRVAQGQLLPTITLEASAQDSRDDPYNTRNFSSFTEERVSGFVGDTNVRSGQVLARLSVPIYQSGAVYSQIRQAREEHNQARIEVAQAVRDVREQAITAYRNYEAALATITASQEQVRAQEIAFEGVEQEALVGSRTVLDVLDAEQELLNARVQLVTAERNEYVAAFTLLSAIGGLTAENLELNTPIYDPEENLDRVRWKFVGWGTPEADQTSPASTSVNYDRARRLEVPLLTGDDSEYFQDPEQGDMDSQ